MTTCLFVENPHGKSTPCLVIIIIIIIIFIIIIIIIIIIFNSLFKVDKNLQFLYNFQ